MLIGMESPQQKVFKLYLKDKVLFKQELSFYESRSNFFLYLEV